MPKKDISAALLVAALAAPSIASAQEVEKEVEKQRTLAGHTFTYPSYSDSAFNSSHFEFSQGFAFTKIDDFEGKGNRLTLLALREKVDLGVKLVDPIGLYGSASGDIISGFHHGEFLYFFGQDAASFDGGVVLVPYRNRRWGTQVGFRSGFELWYSNMLMLDSSTLTFSMDIIDKLNNELFSDQQVMGWGLGGSLNTAQAFGKYVSLQTSVRLMRGRKTAVLDRIPDLETTYNRFGLGAALSTDLNPHLPIALQLEYKLQKLTEMPDMHYLGGGIYFSKDKDLTVGVNAGKQVAESGSSLRSQILARKYF